MSSTNLCIANCSTCNFPHNLPNKMWTCYLPGWLYKLLFTHRDTTYLYTPPYLYMCIPSTYLPTYPSTDIPSHTHNTFLPTNIYLSTNYLPFYLLTSTQPYLIYLLKSTYLLTFPLSYLPSYLHTTTYLLTYMYPLALLFLTFFLSAFYTRQLGDMPLPQLLHLGDMPPSLLLQLGDMPPPLFLQLGDMPPPQLLQLGDMPPPQLLHLGDMPPFKLVLLGDMSRRREIENLTHFNLRYNLIQQVSPI